MNSGKDDSSSLKKELAELQHAVENYHQIERELRRAKDFSESLIDTAHAIVLTLDLDGNITLFNQAAENLTGYSKDEVIGKSWFDVFIPKAEREKLRRVFAAVIGRGREISSYENPIVARDGTEHIINWSNNIIRGDEGGPVGVLSIGIDITERVLAEQSLVAAKDRLLEETEALSQKNIAMTQILDHIEKEREKFRAELAGGIEKLLLPIVKKLREGNGHLAAKDVDYLEDTLKSILGKEIDIFERNLARLSSRELQIAEMIRKGMSSKEIAATLMVSPDTVSKHRESIRRKLQVKHSTLNLSTFLRSRPWPV